MKMQNFALKQSMKFSPMMLTWHIESDQPSLKNDHKSSKLN
jgi:hypothetical protein